LDPDFEAVLEVWYQLYAVFTFSSRPEGFLALPFLFLHLSVANPSSEASWPSSQRVAYVYKAKREINGSRVRVIWGWVVLLSFPKLPLRMLLWDKCW